MSGAVLPARPGLWGRRGEPSASPTASARGRVGARAWRRGAAARPRPARLPEADGRRRATLLGRHSRRPGPGRPGAERCSGGRGAAALGVRSTPHGAGQSAPGVAVCARGRARAPPPPHLCPAAPLAGRTAPARPAGALAAARSVQQGRPRSREPGLLLPPGPAALGAARAGPGPEGASGFPAGRGHSLKTYSALRARPVASQRYGEFGRN